MTSFKGYANDAENERVNNIASMSSFLKIDLNRFLRGNNQMLDA